MIVSLADPHHPSCIAASGFKRGKCLTDFCVPCWVPAVFSDHALKTSLVLTISNDAEQITSATIHNPLFFRERTEKIYYES